MEIKIEFFSQQFRNLREARSLTQEELAHNLGISRQSIIAFERGRCLPSLPLAMAMADLFELELENIFLPAEHQIENHENTSPIELLEKENAWELRIDLPKNVDKEKIEAEIQDGALKISLPKIVKPEPNIIKIRINNN